MCLVPVLNDRSGPRSNGGLVPLGLACAAAVLLTQAPARAEEGDWPALMDPPSIYAKDGVIALTASSQDVKIGAATLPGLVYNGLYTAPVMHARPGERLVIRFINNLQQVSNLHYHGIQTSPLGSSDNASIEVKPGESFLYSVKIPTTQPPGTYWYHPHQHGIVENQVMGGLSGALIIDGFAEQFPELKDIKERLLVLKEYEWESSDDPYIESYLHDRLQTINGQEHVTISMRPHETQLWHIANVGPNKIIHLSIPGLRFRVLGQDGVARNIEDVTETLPVLPGGRFEVLVEAADAGTYNLNSDKVLTGKDRTRVLGHVVVAGEPAVPVPPITTFPSREDLREVDVDTRRTVVFSQDMGAEKFYLDGQQFDHKRTDFRVPLGSVQEWKLVNKTGDFHDFHIHQLHFQVVAMNDKPVPFVGLQDTVRIPEQGSITIRLAFTRPEIVGRFYYHCHVLQHEDRGMMASIEVYDPNAPPTKSENPLPKKAELSPVRSWLARWTSQPEQKWDLPYGYCGL